MRQTLHNEDEKLDMIRDLLIEGLIPDRIYLFGSRGRGDHKEYSDFDIAIEGNNKSYRTMRKVKEDLDAALGIYSCDIVELEKTSKAFKNLVETQGQLIYERD